MWHSVGCQSVPTVIRSRHAFCLALVASVIPLLHSEEGPDLVEAIPQALPWVPPSRLLCESLKEAIRTRPDNLVMRLEDALVMDETNAAELVIAAMDAVNGNQTQAKQILETALKVAPHRSDIVMEAIHSYIPMPEVRPAVLERMDEPEVMDVREEASPVEEIRRAEVVVQPGEEIRRAVLPE